MSLIDDNGSRSGPSPAEIAEMQKYGVRRVPTEYYVYRAYRYAHLADALLQAKLESTMAD